jgi:hypothetical protein
MRKAIMFLGIILIATVILLSGSAVAQTWHFAVSIYDYEYVTDRFDILGPPNGEEAHLGQNPLTLGWIIVDLGEDNEMGRDQDFTVFASSPVLEYYRVYISSDTFEWVPEDGWFGNDSEDHDFTTPGTTGGSWRYIKLVGISGICDPPDPVFGPDIDAVGWYG